MQFSKQCLLILHFIFWSKLFNSCKKYHNSFIMLTPDTPPKLESTAFMQKHYLQGRLFYTKPPLLKVLSMKPLKRKLLNSMLYKSQLWPLKIHNFKFHKSLT